MIGKHKFKVGQRVRPSAYGIGRHIFLRARVKQSGKVMKVDEFNSPTVLWDGRKTAKSHHPDFIEPDRRRVNRAVAGGSKKNKT
jgi:hypothetical protein